MWFSKSASLVIVSLLALRSFAQVEIESIEEIADDSGDQSSTNQPPAVSITTTFPNSEIFGVKLVNGHATSAIISITNADTTPIKIALVGGTLWDLRASTPTGGPVRNLTAIPYNVEIPAGTNQSLTYNFATELHPQDLRLVLAALVTKGDMGYQVAAFNGTVSVVEAPLSFFDPQMIFLYLFLVACFAGTCYFIYNTWIATLFPQKQRGGKGGERAKASSRGSKAVAPPSGQVAAGGADGPAVASGQQALDQSWIGAQHLRRPEAKRVGSGRSAGKVRTK